MRSGTDLETLREAVLTRRTYLLPLRKMMNLSHFGTVMLKNLVRQMCARVRNREYFKQLDFMRNALGIIL